MVSSPPKALVLWGGLEDHHPREGAERVAALLGEQGIVAEITNDYSSLKDCLALGVSLVVFAVTADSIAPQYLEALQAAVSSGVGLAGYHGGIAASFPAAAQTFFFMGGCKWVAHPGGIVDYRVEIVKPDDPVVAGIPSFAYRSEQYYLLVDPAVDVLAVTTFSGREAPWIAGVRMPVVFKKRFGSGRIFYSSLGHHLSEFDVPEMRTILSRGLAWAAGVGFDSPSGP